jgi:hypothetical protein
LEGNVIFDLTRPLPAFAGMTGAGAVLRRGDRSAFKKIYGSTKAKLKA